MMLYNYKMQSHVLNRDKIYTTYFRIIDPGHAAPVIRNAVEFDGYKEAMDNLRRIMPIVGFSRDVRINNLVLEVSQGPVSDT